MAFMSQEKKTKIAAKLKDIVPKDWKWSLRVHHHSTIIFTVMAGPKALTEIPAGFSHGEHHPARTEPYRQINVYGDHLTNSFAPGPVQDLAKKIVAALNTDNFDESDAQTDYFHVGHYVSFHVGRWDKPFKAID